MLVDINLLPKHERKSFHFTFVILSISLLVLIGMGVWLLHATYKMNQKLTIEQQKVDTATRLIEMAQKKKNVQVKPNAAQILQTNIDWIHSNQRSTVKLLDHLVSLLPKRGYFISYEYKDGSTVDLSVQFDTLDETAQYLHDLTESPFIHEATLLEVTTASLEQDENNAGSNTSTDPFSVLPRYIAKYELNMNTNALQARKKG